MNVAARQLVALLGAIRRMNQQHARYPIPNDEYLYTLSTFIFEPIRWNARFGWRRMLPVEKRSAYYGWREIGKCMEIRDIPPSYDAFEQFNLDFERAHFRYAPENEQLAKATRNLLLSWVLPKALWPLGAPFIHALIDDHLLMAVGLPLPPAWMRHVVAGALRMRSAALRRFPPKRTSVLPTHTPSRTYPQGY